MKKRLICLAPLYLASLFLFLFAAHAQGERRALLIGCDHFVSHADTAPAAAMNVRRMARMLQSDARGYAHVAGKSNGLVSADELFETIRTAFSGAQEGDVSLLYICTHGLYDRVTCLSSLVLSDGVREETIGAPALREALDEIPGTKVLLIDACNSGAFIGKGDWNEALRSAFDGEDYKVLTSASASEDSFLWHADNLRHGGSYFASELCEGFEGRGFDLNGDGAVTLREAYQGLWESHGASTPQCYPQESDFVLYAYDPAAPYTGERAISDVTLDTNAISLNDARLYFSFTVRSETRVQYQIVYYRDGAWRFSEAKPVTDTEGADGLVSPGRKERSLLLSADDGEASGYVLLQIISSNGERAMLAASRLIAVRPDAGDPGLRVWTRERYSPENGAELSINVQHAFPGALTVTVCSLDGSTVKRLCYKQLSRPLGLPGEGSIFFWDGKTAKGAPASPGGYYIEVSCVVGGVTYSRRSDLFLLESL